MLLKVSYWIAESAVLFEYHSLAVSVDIWPTQLGGLQRRPRYRVYIPGKIGGTQLACSHTGTKMYRKPRTLDNIKIGEQPFGPRTRDNYSKLTPTNQPADYFGL